MREIKFRAWHPEEGRMYYDVTTNGYVVRWGTSIHGGYEYDYKFTDVTVMQFTGLKDKNGKEIYEGDIVQHWAFPKGNLFDVQWDETTGAFSGYGVFDEWEDSEVIGNIYENPDLLK